MMMTLNTVQCMGVFGIKIKVNQFISCLANINPFDSSLRPFGLKYIFVSTIDTPSGVPGVSKDAPAFTELEFGDLVC